MEDSPQGIVPDDSNSFPDSGSPKENVDNISEYSKGIIMKIDLFNKYRDQVGIPKDLIAGVLVPEKDEIIEPPEIKIEDQRKNDYVSTSLLKLCDYANSPVIVLNDGLSMKQIFDLHEQIKTNIRNLSLPEELTSSLIDIYKSSLSRASNSSLSALALVADGLSAYWPEMHDASKNLLQDLQHEPSIWNSAENNSTDTSAEQANKPISKYKIEQILKRKSSIKAYIGSIQN